MITENCSNTLQIVARPGPGATYRLQRPLHELVGLLSEFQRWRRVRRPVRQYGIHMAPVFRKRRQDAIESLRRHGLA